MLIIIIGSVAFFWPRVATMIDASGWHLAFYVLAAVVTVRVALAPYWMWRDTQLELATLRHRLPKELPAAVRDFRHNSNIVAPPFATTPRFSFTTAEERTDIRLLLEYRIQGPDLRWTQPRVSRLFEEDGLTKGESRSVELLKEFHLQYQRGWRFNTQETGAERNIPPPDIINPPDQNTRIQCRVRAIVNKEEVVYYFVVLHVLGASAPTILAEEFFGHNKTWL